MRLSSLFCTVTASLLHTHVAAASCAQVFPAAGALPADRVSFLYYAESSLPPAREEAPMPRMYRLEGSTKVLVPYASAHDPLSQALRLTPTVEQPVGAQLVVETDVSRCDDAPLHATYSITERRALPSTLGTLHAQTERASASVDIVLSDDALPFASLWRYQLYVDDMPHVASSDEADRTHGHAHLRAQCRHMDASVEAPGTLAPGAHVVHFEAQLGDEPPLRTPDITIELRCAP